MTTELKWPANSVLYTTIRELRRIKSKPNYSNIFAGLAKPKAKPLPLFANLLITKPAKPNRHRRRTK